MLVFRYYIFVYNKAKHWDWCYRLFNTIFCLLNQWHYCPKVLIITTKQDLYRNTWCLITTPDLQERIVLRMEFTEVTLQVQLIRIILFRAESYLYKSKTPVSVWLCSCATKSTSLPYTLIHTPCSPQNRTWVLTEVWQVDNLESS